MSKKVSELTKELDIKLEELKVYADKMGISINSARDSVEDFDAARIISTINLMKGNKTDSSASSAKPKIKATPVINKDTAKKSPIGKPVIPKKAVVPPKKVAEEPKPEDQTAPSEAEAEKVQEVISDSKEEPAAENAAPEKAVSETPAPSVEKSEPSPAPEAPAPVDREPETQAEEPEKVIYAPVTEPEPEPESQPQTETVPEPEKKEEAAPVKDTEPEEEYVNAPNKPMRFKKISDAATEKKKAEELRKRQQERRDKSQSESRDKDQKNRRNKDNRDKDNKDNKDAENISDNKDIKDEHTESEYSRKADSLPETYRKKVRTALKGKEIPSAHYSSIYKAILNSYDKLALNNLMVKTFGSSKGGIVYNQIKDIFTDYHQQA